MKVTLPRSGLRTTNNPHTNSSDAYGVVAYGTVVWKDNGFPTPNEPISCSGGWTIFAQGSSIVGNRIVKYGRFIGTSPLVYIENCSSNTFSFSAGNITGSQIGIKTSAKVKNSSGSEGYVYLSCLSSPLD